MISINPNSIIVDDNIQADSRKLVIILLTKIEANKPF